MPDNTLEILIKTKAELAGFQAALLGMERQIGAAKAMGRSTADLEQQLAAGRQRLADYTAANHDAAGEVEHMEISHHALHHIMSMIGQETVPELGHALTGLLYGPLGAVIALGSAFEFFKNMLGEANQKLEEMASNNALAAWAESIKAVRADLAASKQTLAEFADEMKRGADETTRANDALDKSLKVLKARSEQAKILADARGETPIQQAAREHEEHQTELDTRIDDLKQAEDRQKGLEAKAVAAENARLAAEDRKKKSTVTEAEALKQQEEHAKKAKELTGQADYQQGIANTRGTSEADQGLAYLAQKRADELRSQAKDEQAAADTAKRNAEKARQISEAPTLAKVEADKAKVEAEKNKADVADKKKQVDDLADRMNIVDPAKRYAAALGTQAGPFTGAQIEQVAIAERLMRAHQPVTEQQNELVKQFEEFSKSQGDFANRLRDKLFIIGGILSSLNDKDQALETFLREVKRSIGDHQGQINNNNLK